MSETERESGAGAAYQIRKGFRFLHVSWRNAGRYSLAEIKALPATATAQEFVVTKVAKTLVYYRPVYRHSGEVTNLGGAFVESIDKMSEHVLCAADERGMPVHAATEAEARADAAQDERSKS